MIIDVNIYIYKVYDLFTRELRIIGRLEIISKILPSVMESWHSYSWSTKDSNFESQLTVAVLKVVLRYYAFILFEHVVRCKCIRLFLLYNIMIIVEYVGRSNIFDKI